MFLTYYGTRWLSTKTNLAARSKYMNIVDRMVVGQNKLLAIVEITNKYYLLSITEKDVSIIKELEDFKLKTEEEKTEAVEFKKILSNFLKK